MNHFDFRLLTVLILAGGLVGCAATTASTPASDEPVAPPARAASAAADLPRIELAPDMMYEILVGEIALQRGQIGIAAQLFGRVAQKTHDPRLAERATLAAFHARQFDDALRSAQLWAELRPQDVEAREAHAVVLLELGRFSEAQVELEQLLAIEGARGQLDQGYLRAAAVLGRNSDRAAAMNIMQTLVQHDPESAAANLYAAHLAVRAGEYAAAARSADLALKYQPGWEEAAIFRVRIFVSQKEFPAAHTFYSSFLDRYPRAAGVRLSYARFLVDQKQWDNALAQFKRLLADAPEDADAIYAAGLLALQTNRPDEAERYLLRTIELKPENDQARLYLGQIAEQAKRYEEAIRRYKEVDDGDSYFEAQMRLAGVIAKQGDVDAARDQLHAIPVENDQQRVQRALAEEQILSEAKRHKDALAMLNETIAALPDDKDLLYARALVAEKLGMIELTESDLRAILKADPKNANALNALGYTLADRTTRYQEALALLQEAIQLKPDDPFVLDSLGWVHYRLGNHTEAIKHIRRALELRSDAEIAAHLGEVLWVSGQRTEAESVWKRALSETPDNEALIGVIKKFQP